MKPTNDKSESFAELRKRSRMVHEKPTRTVVTTGAAAEREMQAMERRVAAAKPQHKAAGGPIWNGPLPIDMPVPKNKILPIAAPNSPLPLLKLSGTGAKRGGRQSKKGGRGGSKS